VLVDVPWVPMLALELAALVGGTLVAGGAYVSGVGATDGLADTLACVAVGLGNSGGDATVWRSSTKPSVPLGARTGNHVR
jgi:hypothetical protein